MAWRGAQRVGVRARGAEHVRVEAEAEPGDGDEPGRRHNQ